MAKQELVIGLRNAVERGESLQEAMQTLLASGYDPKEVQEAASYVDMGVIGKLPAQAPQAQEESQPQSISQQTNQAAPQLVAQQPIFQPQALPKLTAPAQEQVKPRKKLKLLTIILIVILAILGAGIVFFMLFGNQILKSLFSQ